MQVFCRGILFLGTRKLFKALLLSLVVHLFFLGGWAAVSKGSARPARRIDVTIAPVRLETQKSEPTPDFSAGKQVQVAQRRGQRSLNPKKDELGERTSSDAATKAAIRNTESGIRSAESDLTADGGSVVNREGIQQYRFDLARKMRGWRPPIAVATGGLVEDVVLLRVESMHGSNIPGVVLVRSSGNRTLDDFAYESLKRAVGFTPVPEALGQSAFSFVVPIHSWLAE